MSFTAYTTNPGSGGSSLPSQAYGGFSWLASLLAYGADGGPFSLVGIKQGLPVTLSDGQKSTYSSAGTVSLAAAPTDAIELNNSAGSKTLKVLRVSVTGSAGTAILVPVVLIKRTTLNTSGTSSTPTPTLHDSVNDSAATGVVKVYTSNPTTGSSGGNVRYQQLNFAVSGALSTFTWEFNWVSKEILLASNQSLVINLAGTSISSGVLNWEITWTEE